MLEIHLQNSINELDKLIELTHQDISLVKRAEHIKLIDNIDQKNHLMLSFENQKALLNQSLMKLVEFDERPLEEILTKDQHELMELFKNKLLELKNVNIQFSKFVLSVGDFYNELFDKIFTLDRSGYQKTTPLPAAFFKTRA